MRVSEEHITEEQKKEAQRRIQGSSVQDSPGDSHDERRQSLPPTMSTLAASSL